ncbi:MAG TPA: lipase maturation factor family protein [Acidimicrobiales bacterium]|nr:lipase maturation factor family protein [Acidimicrobiales bacterium]
MRSGWLWAPGHWESRLFFTRALAAVYLIAFVAAVAQFRPLIGSGGVLPVPRFVARVPFRRAPSVFQLRYSDGFFAGCCWFGAALAAAGLAGGLDRAPVWGWMLAWGALWALYLSVVNVGQVWYGFGWESLLVETGFLAVFLGPAGVAPPRLVLWLLRWLLLRLELGAGLIKLRGDPCWRDLTCLQYHHETQPLPNPFSWRFHNLPPRLHRIEVLANHATQLVVIWGVLAPQPVASVAAGVVVVTQLWLMLSGNFAWLNALTITIALSVIDGRVLHQLLPVSPGHALARPAGLAAAVLALTAFVAALSWRPARNLLSRHQRMNAAFDPLHLVNTYGAFGHVTRERREVVVEGTADPHPGPGTEWREYRFRGKPGDLRRRPPQVAPYHLRLDWLLWFVGISPVYADPWLVPFLAQLLRNDPATLRLLGESPFPDGPPVFVRARLYRYRFTTPQERRATGEWWARTLTGDLVRPFSLSGERGIAE